MGGGCNRKLARVDLERLLASSGDLVSEIPKGSGIRQRLDLGDACEVALDAPTDRLITSMDLVYPVAEDWRTWGIVGVTHALSDLYASLATPIYATITLGLSAPMHTGGEGAQVLDGVLEALHRDGTVLAGGHSVSSAEPFLDVAVTGSRGERALWREPRAGDALILTKPLGTGIALAARRMGVVDEADLSEEYASMGTSNAITAEALREAMATWPGAVAAVTDVSGFGLLDALKTLAGTSTVEIYGAAVPRFEKTATLARAQAWSQLADANLVASESYTRYVNAEDGFLPALLNDPQTSGGLLAVLSEAVADELLELNGFDATSVIGRILARGGCFEVTVDG